MPLRNSTFLRLAILTGPLGGTAHIAWLTHASEQLPRKGLVLQSKGVTLFSLVDHSEEAEKVGMKVRPIKLLIFGSPKAGHL